MGGIVENTSKKEMAELFEKYLDDIMSKDKSKFFEMSQIIKNKMFDLGDKMLENWSSDNILTEESNNEIIKDDNEVKKNSI